MVNRTGVGFVMVPCSHQSGSIFQTVTIKNNVMSNKKLVGRKAKIISDNDNYDNYRDKVLVITHASNRGRGYDSTMYPEMLCDFMVQGGTAFPFALYEYEFELLD